MNKFKVGQKVKVIRTGKIGRINQIDDNDINKYGCSLRCYEVIFNDYCFNLWYTVHDLEPVKEILDTVEKEYINNIIKPFKKKVIYIVKGYNYEDEYIKIEIKGDASIVLPNFKPNTMYKGMKIYKEYTLSELGLYD